MTNQTCEVVKNQVLGKDFYYCRGHRCECTYGGCLEAMPQKPSGVDSPIARERATYSKKYGTFQSLKPGDWVKVLTDNPKFSGLRQGEELIVRSVNGTMVSFTSTPMVVGTEDVVPV